jgi:polysaccharide export outer membrane protein
MKLRVLFILAFFASALVLPVPALNAQDKDAAAGKPADAPALPSVAPPPVAAAAPTDTYIIGASDVLNVTVWKEATLSGSLLVRPDGMITVPLLGDVQASGLTPLALGDQIATKLKKYIQDPKVSVVVTAIHSKVIFLLGEFAKKGSVEMTPGMTLLQAIANAGGFSEFANVKKAYILRDEGGKRVRIPVQYKEALKGNSELDLVLKPGDTIVAP